MENTGTPTNLETILDQARDCWTFAGDFLLLQWMSKISQDLESRATTSTENLDRLNCNVNYTHAALDNVANSLTALQYGNQFVECRVQDDDETSGHGIEGTINGVDKNEKPTSKEILAAFLDNNLRLLHNCHEKYSLDIDDSDEEEEILEKTCIFQPINPYNERPLPHIFGSKEWQAKWHVGLSSDQQDNCYSGDEISEVFSESSSSAAADNDSYESNSECASSFSIGNDNFGGNFEVRNASPFLHSKVSNTDPVSETSSTHSSTAKIKSYNPQSLVEGLPSRSESVSSSNSKTESSHVKPIISRVTPIGKPGIFKSNVPPYTDLFAEPPEDLGSTTSTPSSNISRKPINLFNDDDDEVFKHLVIAGSKRNDPVVVSQNKTNNIERAKTTVENTSTQKRSVDGVNSNSISKSVFSEEIDEGLFSTTAIPKDVIKDDNQKKSEAYPSGISQTPRNLFDDDDDDYDFLSAFVEKQKSSLTPGSRENLENQESTQTNRNIFGSIEGNINISKNKNINLFDDYENANQSNYEKPHEMPKDDRKQKNEIKQSISTILKSTNLFDDDDEDDDDFFKTKPSIYSPKKFDSKKVGEVRQRTDTQQAMLKSKTFINDKSDLAVVNAVKEDNDSSLDRKSITLFDDIEDGNMVIIKTLGSTHKSPNTDISEASLPPITTPKQGNKLEKEEEIIVKNRMPPSKTSDTIQPIVVAHQINQQISVSTSSKDAFEDHTTPDFEGKSIGVDNGPMSTNYMSDENVLDKESSLKNTEQNKFVEQNIIFSESGVSAPVEEMINNNVPMLNQNTTELILESQNSSDVEIPQDNKEDDSVSKNYDFNSSLIFDEPPDDNDFFETLGKSSQNPNTKYNSFDLENDLYPEPDLPVTPTAEKTSEYKGLQLFSDIPPEDNDFDDVMPQKTKTEYTKRLNSVFYDDFNETLLALGRSQDQTTSSHSTLNRESPDFDVDKQRLEQPVVVNSNQEDLVDHQIESDKSSKEDAISQQNPSINRSISKLQLPNININVHALLPGTSFKIVQKQDQEPEKTWTVQQASFTNDAIQTIETGHILPSINKNRVRAPSNRRPSTRKARHENYRKSLLEDQLTNSDDDKNLPENNGRNHTEKQAASKTQKQSNEQAITSSSAHNVADNANVLNTTVLPSPVSDRKSISSFETVTPQPSRTFFDEEDDDDKLFQSITSNKAPASFQNVSNKTALLNKDVPASSSRSAVAGTSDIVTVKSSSNKLIAVNREIKTSSKKMFIDSDSASEDDLFAKLGSSKTTSIAFKREKHAIVVKSPVALSQVDASKKHTSLFSDDSDDDDFLKTSAKRHVPKRNPKVPSHTNNKSIFSDIDSDDSDLFEATPKVTNSQTPNVRLPSKQPTKQSIADNNPLADLL